MTAFCYTFFALKTSNLLKQIRISLSSPINYRVLKNRPIAVLGDGGWGTTLALLLANKGKKVILWGAFKPYLQELAKTRQNAKYLPGFKLPKSILIEPDINKAVNAAGFVVLATPSQYLRGVLAKITSRADVMQKCFINVSKGIEVDTLSLMSEVIHGELGPVHLAIISGPTIARDVAIGYPSAASVACHNAEMRASVRELFSTRSFKLFETADVRAVELGGSVKNVIAIGAGILQGLELGSNARALLFARGVAEMARLGKIMGCSRESFMGLSGLGDLATTCLSPLSRNRSFGEQIGKGVSAKSVLRKSAMVVEGVETSKAVWKLSRKHGIHMPICEAVYKVLFMGKKPSLVSEALLLSKSPMEKD